MNYTPSNRIIEEANGLLYGKIAFTNDWDMERCSTPYHKIGTNGANSPNGDGEWVYQYSRLEFLHKLVYAYKTTGDKKYIVKHFEYIKDFYDNNNARTGKMPPQPSNIVSKFWQYIVKGGINRFLSIPYSFPTYRTLDTAIRNYSILVDLEYIKELKEYSLYKPYLSRIKEDVIFQYQNLRPFDRQSNWGVIIVSLSIVSKLIIGEVTHVDSLERTLNDFLNVQIKKDGGHAECAFMYQNQILLCLLRYIYWSRLYNHEVNVEILEKAKVIANYTSLMTAPNGMQIQYGDSDKTPLNTLNYLSTHLLGTSVYLDSELPFDEILLMEFANLDITNELVKNNSHNPKRNCILDNNWCYFDGTFHITLFNETGSSAHSHADNGEVILYYKKLPLFIDCGRYSYYDMIKRAQYRGPYAHSTLMLDKGANWVFNSANQFAMLPEPGITRKIDGEYDQGVITSFSFPTDGNQFVRSIHVLDNLVVIASGVKTVGSHSFDTVWCVPDYAITKINKHTFSIFISDINENVYFYCNDDYKIENGHASFYYNDEEEIKKIVVSTPIIDEGYQFTVLASEQCRVETLSYKSGVLKLTLRDGRVIRLNIDMFQNG